MCSKSSNEVAAPGSLFSSARHNCQQRSSYSVPQRDILWTGRTSVHHGLIFLLVTSQRCPRFLDNTDCMEPICPAGRTRLLLVTIPKSSIHSRIRLVRVAYHPGDGPGLGRLHRRGRRTHAHPRRRFHVRYSPPNRRALSHCRSKLLGFGTSHHSTPLSTLTPHARGATSACRPRVIGGLRLLELYSRFRRAPTWRDALSNHRPRHSA
ncbi:hypothetical protein B0H12DRAFT_193360 [Mycena haematopus]|nr:hypothetical protein B0H12DRAFT_193360 [Mycena haematopus]